MSTRSPIQVEVIADQGESADSLIKRFMRAAKKSRVVERAKDKMRYKKPSEIRRAEKIRKEMVEKKLISGKKIYYKNEYL